MIRPYEIIMSEEKQNALVILAKFPREGKVKTRLIPPLNPKEAAFAYQAFLLDTLENTLSLEKNKIERYLACSPSVQEKFFQALSQKYCLQLLEQKGENLGEKMEDIFLKLLHNPYRKVIIIGSDSPTLPLSYIIQAFSLLDKVDLTIGPAYDGGYYLIGISREISLILEEIPWGTDRVISVTLKKVMEMEIKFQLLYPWYDIDDLEGLKYLYAQLNFHSQKEKKDYPHCSQFFSTLARSKRINKAIYAS